MSARYPVPATTHRVEEEIQRSRFIATIARAASVQEAQAFVRAVSAEFADATHNCWAYVVGAPGSTGQIGMSDDGEPHGTAGRPMLTVLLHSGLGDVAAVVTRYYGGTKLGTGGLARAYSGAVQQAVVTVARAERVTLVEIAVHIGYGDVSAVQQLAPQFEAEIVAQEYGTEVAYRIRLPEEQAEGFRRALGDATRGQARVDE